MYKIFKDIKKTKPINKVLLLSFLVLFIISIFEIQSLIKTIGNVTGVPYGGYTHVSDYSECNDQPENAANSYNYYVKSVAYTSGADYADVCLSAVTLREYACTEWHNGHKNVITHLVDCPDGCGDGACLPAPLPIPSCEGDVETCLISYYTFDDNTVDENGVNDAAIMNGVNCGSEGYKGKACRFDGIDDYLTLGNPDSLRLTNDLTISAWINILGSTMADQTIITRRMDLTGLYATNILYELSYTQSGNLRLRWNYGDFNLAECLSSSTVSKNKWHHIAVVRDVEATSSVQLYVDGALKGSCVSLPNPAGGAIPSMQVWVGRNNYPAGFNTLYGKIDELKIYNKALSESEINFINSTTLSAPQAPQCTPTETICTDGMDNDCDGKIDSADEVDCPFYCTSHPSCIAKYPDLSLPKCDLTTGECVKCTANTHCLSTQVCDQATHTCKAKCTAANKAIVCTGGLTVCGPGSFCVECIADADCGTTEVCDTSTNICKPECASDGDCFALDPSLPKCISAGFCVECTGDEDCDVDAGQTCNIQSNTCVFLAVAPVCTGNTPSNSVLCSGDDAGLTIDTAKTLVSSCTSAAKCEYACASGYTKSGSTCVSSGACSTIGLRISGNYCNVTKGLQQFKAAGSSCNQHYECIDNICDNSVCKSYTILQQTYCYLLDQLDETDDELC